jgi:antitoxin HigA-1
MAATYGNHPGNSLEPIHPGEIILEEFLKPYRMTPYRLAKGLRMTPTAISEILHGKRSITAGTALRLSAFLGCTPRFWMNLQAAYDLELAKRELADLIPSIERYRHEGPVVLDEEQFEAAAAAG